MTTPYRVFASGVPIINQHAPDPDGQATPGNDWDCGESCVISIVQQCYGLTALTVEDVRRDLLHDSTGTTSPAQLSGYLAGECNIPNTLIVPTTRDAYLWNEYRYLREGKALIALRYFERIGAPSLHYCTVTEQTETCSVVMDPWSSAFVTEQYDVHWNMALGHSTLIGIDRLP